MADQAFHPVADAADLLERGRESKRIRTRTMATRIVRDLHQLAGMVAGEAELAELEAKVAAARKKAAGRDGEQETADG